MTWIPGELDALKKTAQVGREHTIPAVRDLAAGVLRLLAERDEPKEGAAIVYLSPQGALVRLDDYRALAPYQPIGTDHHCLLCRFPDREERIATLHGLTDAQALCYVGAMGARLASGETMLTHTELSFDVKQMGPGEGEGHE